MAPVAWCAAGMQHKRGAVMPNIIRKHRIALLTGCALLAQPLFITPAAAGCNSGNVANTNLLSDAACEAAAAGASATAVGAGSTASGSNSSAYGLSSTASGAGSSA